jgi:2-dehydropantoate 2-reductase
MKIAIVGAGSIGGYLGASLAASGEHAVSALARGATLAALRQHGWRVREAFPEAAQRPAEWGAPLAHASEHAAELGPQDAVFIAVKGQALPALAPKLLPLIGPHTLIVPAMNGVPWWFCMRQPAWAGRSIAVVDPTGSIARSLPLAQVLGCVVHMACASPEPGLVLHRMGRGLILGECDAKEPGSGPISGPVSSPISARVQALTQACQEAGLEASASADVRRDIWYKLWGNLTMNPISALTGATFDQVLSDPLVRQLCTDAMLEASEIGQRIGCPIEQTPEDRHAITMKLGAVKTSMLQDVEAGRAIELDAIVSAVREIAQTLAIATPRIDSLLGLTRLMARTRGLYPAAD